LPIYTCFDMVVDCRNGKAAGWIYFVKNFAEPLRLLLRHYARPGAVDDARFAEFLRHFHAGAKALLDSLEPLPSREFLMKMRPHVLAATPEPERPDAVPLDLDTLAEAFESYTATERQFVWLETMGYAADESATMMRAAPETVSKLRARSAELLRAKLDRWNETILLDNGRALCREAAARKPENPISFRDVTDLIDGRNTWQKRNELEREMVDSWYEVEQVCQVREADDAMTACKPLDDVQAQALLDVIGIRIPKKTLWQRIAGR
jgi:hypothetical protein